MLNGGLGFDAVKKKKKKCMIQPQQKINKYPTYFLHVIKKKKKRKKKKAREKLSICWFYVVTSSLFLKKMG